MSWLLLLFFSLSALPVAAADFPPSVRPPLTPETLGRLAEAAEDPALPPWQREYMLEVARGTGTDVDSASPMQDGALQHTAHIAADDGAWIGTPVSPSARAYDAAIYDPVRDRMLVFGGYDSLGLHNDVWALSLSSSPAWSVLAPTGTPPSARGFHTAIYDPVRDRMLVFGGAYASPLNDVWALSLAGSPAWSALVPSGTPPSARYGHTAIYDPVRDRMLVFGGWDGSVVFNDVWVLSLAGNPAWSALGPSGTPPSARAQHTAVYDPVRDQMLVFGGGSFGVLNDVWALALEGGPAWAQLAPAGTPPSARYGHTAIYDPVRDQVLVFGGLDDSTYFNDAWTLSLAGGPAWSVLGPTGTPPSTRAFHTAIYDPVRDRMLVFGGYDGSHNSNDVQALSPAGSPGWSALVTTPPPPPSPRSGHGSIYDPLRDRMLVFGGYDGSTDLNDVWALSLTGIPSWSQLAPAGTSPPGHEWHTAIYDPVRDRMLVFGGANGSVLLNGVWALSLAGSSVWSQLVPTGTPPSARVNHTAIYDPVRERMLVFGGYDGSFLLNDVWALSLDDNPAWSLLAPSGTRPTGRYAHAAIYDPLRDRMLVFGGWDGNYRNDVWALSLAGSPAWNALAPAGSLPSWRYAHTAIYDRVRDRMLVFGGYSGSVYLNDAWALSLSGPAWTALAPTGTAPSRRLGHTAIYDPVRDRMLVFAGYDGVFGRNDLWTLLWGTPVSVPVGDTPPSRFTLMAPRPSPSLGPVTLDFTVPQATHVSLVVYDAAGRMIRKLVDEQLLAGRHSVSWDSRDRNGRSVPRGVYLVRLAAPGAQLVSKAVIVGAGSIE